MDEIRNKKIRREVDIELKYNTIAKNRQNWTEHLPEMGHYRYSRAPLNYLQTKREKRNRTTEQTL